MIVRDYFLPPCCYGAVEDDLYRGSYPAERNYPFLKILKLRSILSLTPEPPSKGLLDFCKENNIGSYHLRVDVPDDKVTVAYNKLTHILRLVSSPELRPMYVHCTNGERVTGIIFMCFRKLQNWSLGSITSENARYMKTGSVTKRDEEFVIKFSLNYDFKD